MWNPFSRSNSVSTLRDRGVAADRPAKVHVAVPQGKSGGEIAQIDVIEGIAVVTLTVDELSGHDGAAMLADLLDQVVESAPEHIVLDIQNVLFMDSSCVGCMVEALNRLAASGGRIALVNPGTSVAHIFRITRLDRVFPICSDVLAAMKAVRRTDDAD